MRALRKAAVVAAAATGTVGLALAADAGGDTARTLKAFMQTGDGKTVGRVELSAQSRSGPVSVGFRISGLTPGFHGFHVHERGLCEGPSFTSAGGHLKLEGQVHRDHVGDMPVILVGQDGTARGSFVTDRFTLSDLRDADGSAVMVHANPDNYANIPTDRYDPDPDAITLNTGDAGARVACGAVR